MYAELSSALDNAGIVLPESADITTLGTVAELQELLARGPVAAARERAAQADARRRRRDPRARRRSRRRASAGWRGRSALFYQRVLSTRACAARATFPSTPTSSSPPTTPRTSTWARSRSRWATPGRDLTSLAAADYFFRNRYRRAYFKHFTNLVPMERCGIDPQVDGHRRGGVAARAQHGRVPGRDAIGHAASMAEFLPSLGYLAMRAEVGVLPAHVAGSFEALPKGTAVPRARELTVTFGPFLSREWLAALTHGLSAQEAWRLVAAFVQRVVENLRDGVATALDVEAVRAAWDGERWARSRCAAPRRRRLLRSVP